MIWGRQDPHIPREGRRLVQDAMSAAGVRFTWHEFNGQHAFIRDEGHRYDPELARLCHGLVLELFHRRLGEGRRERARGGAGDHSSLSRAAAADLAQRVEHGARGGCALLAHDRGLHVPDGRVAGQRHGCDLLGVEEDVEPVREGDAAAGGDERLRLDRLVPVPGVQDRGPEPGALEHVIDHARRRPSPSRR